MLNNNIFDSVTASAIDLCVNAGIPFACYMTPDSDTPVFLAQSPESFAAQPLSPSEVDSFRGFLISTFALGSDKHFYGITGTLTAARIVEICPASVALNLPDNGADTSRQRYLADVKHIVDSLDGDGEKAVYARRLSITTSLPVSAVAQRYFSAHPSCFRFVYHTPYTGTWIGTSPELILSTDSATGRISTLALAGTRPAEESDREWSSKNIMEHEIVVRYLLQVLTGLCGNAAADRRSAVRFGSIEHLATPVGASCPAKLSQLLTQLSPTPALCGFPVDKAYSLITSLETFTRGCYGGTVGECSPEGARIYVNLRSAQIIAGDTYTYRLYAGGGITRHSVPSDEWDETERKMQSLSEIIMNHIS